LYLDFQGTLKTHRTETPQGRRSCLHDFPIAD
jgi:hypothetical protein